LQIYCGWRRRNKSEQFLNSSALDFEQFAVAYLWNNYPIMTTTTNNQLSSYEDESEILHCLQSGDQRDFTKLYDRFSAAVFGLILKWVNDYGTAENLLQDVFIKAWRSRELYDPSKGRIFTWLYNITRHLCIDYLRSKAYKKSKVSVLSDNLHLVLPGKNTDTVVTDTIGLRKLVRNLKQDEKKVVELMYFKGFTQKEIAELMNIPIGTVKTKMSKAIKNLRRFFLKDLENGIGSISLN
jgi:RNA polymerase sigma factor (sigma-70 family)